MSLSRVFPPEYVFHTSNGQEPNDSGKVYFYVNESGTLATVYSDVDGNTPSANPLTLGSDGRLPNDVYTNQVLRVKVVDSSDAQISQDDHVMPSAVGNSVESIADAKALALADGASVHIKGYGRYYYDASSTATAIANVILTPDSGTGRLIIDTAERLTLHHFGAVGDGSTDDTAAIQRALDYNRDIYVLPGKYRTTSNLLVDPARNRNCGLIGSVIPSIYPETTQTGGPTWDGDDECVIFYDGSTGATTAVIAATPEAVGTEPTSTFANTVYGFRLRGVTLDGNNKAHYGLFSARLQQIELADSIARNTQSAGFHINGTYSGRIDNIVARNNYGRGICIGTAARDLGWTTNSTINGLTIGNMWAYANGRDGDFDESTAPYAGAGVHYAPHRGCTLVQVTSELNDGPGVVYEPTSSGNVIGNIYTELNSTFDHTGGGSAISAGRTTKAYGLIYVGSTNAYGNRVDTGFIAAEYLWITGTEPSTGRPESAPEFANIVGGSGIVADYANYRLVNMGKGFISGITGSAPTGASHHPQGFILDADGSSAAFRHYRATNFTPTLEGASVAGTGWAYSKNQGRAWRIGDVLFVSIEFSISTVGSGASGNVLIKGLPETIKSGDGYDASFAVGAYSGLSGAVTGLVGFGPANGTDINLNKLVSGAGSTALAVSDLSGSTTFHISGFYAV